MLGCTSGLRSLSNPVCMSCVHTPPLNPLVGADAVVHMAAVLPPVPFVALAVRLVGGPRLLRMALDALPAVHAAALGAQLILQAWNVMITEECGPTSIC